MTLRYTKLYLKSVYTKLFPLDTFRRFVADQLLQTLYQFTYYGSLISSITIAVLFILYNGGRIVFYITGPPTTHPHPISLIIIGFLSILFLSIMMVSLYLIWFFIIDTDYSSWLKARQSSDDASNLYMKFFPKVSFRAYAASRLFYITATITAITVYVILSIKIFKMIFGTPMTINGLLPDSVILVLSASLQVASFFILGLFQLIAKRLLTAYRNAYASHLERASSSTAKRNDTFEIRLTLK